MKAGLLIFVLALSLWNAESQFLPGTGFQQQIPTTASTSPCGCPSAKQFVPIPENILSKCRSCLSNTRSQCDNPSNLASFEPQSVCDLPSQALGSFGKDCGCGSATPQFLSSLSQTLRSPELRNFKSQCESPSPLGEFGTGPCKLFPNINSPSNFPSVSSCNIQSPLSISNCPSCGLNNFAGPLTNQVTETITTQVPSLTGKKQFVSETLIGQNPYQSSSSFGQNGFPLSSSTIFQNSGDRFCTSPTIETCFGTGDDDELMSVTLANALQLLIISNLIENLNEATALGTFNSLQSPCNVIENFPGCKDFGTTIQSISTGCSNIPSLYSPSSIGSLSLNPFEAQRQVSCNRRLTESINPIRVPPLSAFGGVPEIVNTKISFNAPNIPDVINPTNLKLAEAINSQRPFGLLPTFNRNFADNINPIQLPSLPRPTVLPEIGNPVNLPGFVSGFPNNAEVNPFKVQSFSPLAPTPGLVAYNMIDGPLQIPQPFSYNKFDGPFLTDAFNYNGPLQPELNNYNQFNEPSNPLMALLKQLLIEKSNGYIQPFESSNTYNPYSSYGGYPEQNPFSETYGSPFEVSNQYGSNYPVSATSALLDIFSSQSPYGAKEEILGSLLSALGRSSYTENLEATLPISLSSPSYASEAFSQTSSNSFNTGFVDFPSSGNPYSHPEIVFVPVDLPGLPVTLTGSLPEAPFSVSPSEGFCEVKDIPAQIRLEPFVAELLIPSSIPAALTVSF